MVATDYDFVVRGRVTAAQLERLAPLRASATPEGNTRLRGVMRDHAELNGVLRRLSAAGLVLQEVRPAAAADAFPARYEVDVDATLSAAMRQAFTGAEIQELPSGTRLVVGIADQAALDRFLERIEALGLRLRSARRIDAAPGM